MIPQLVFDIISTELQIPTPAGNEIILDELSNITNATNIQKWVKFADKLSLRHQI